MKKIEIVVGKKMNETTGAVYLYQRLSSPLGPIYSVLAAIPCKVPRGDYGRGPVANGLEAHLEALKIEFIRQALEDAFNRPAKTRTKRRKTGATKRAKPSLRVAKKKK